jgi:hypothetical protein
MRIISIDCGTVALGVCICDFDTSSLRQFVATHFIDMHNMQKIVKSIKKRVCTLELNLNDVKEQTSTTKQQLLSMYNEFKCINKQLHLFEEFNTLYVNICKLVYIDVINLIPNKLLRDTDIILRSSRLHGFVTYIKHLAKTLDVKQCSSDSGNRSDCGENIVLIEYQMSVNDKSKIICNQLAVSFVEDDFAFASFTKRKEFYDSPAEVAVATQSKFETHIVGCSIKNRISFNHVNLNYETFLPKYQKSYDANKAHCKANLIEWARLTKNEDKISIIDKKVLKDASDAFMMAFAWIVYEMKDDQLKKIR